MTATTGSDRATRDALVDEVARTREELRDEARAALGVTGDRNTEGVRVLLRRHRLSLYPLTALGLLAVVDTFQGYAFVVLAPDISRSLGLGVGLIALSLGLKSFATALAPLPMAWLAQRGRRRAALCIVTGFAWSVLTLYTGLVTSLFGLVAILVLDGLSTGSVSALHPPLLMDSYHPELRVRALSAYSAMNRVGDVLAPLMVGLLAGLMGFTWRGVFIAMGITSIFATAYALRLRDPGFGTWDTQQIREAVHDKHGERTALGDEEVALGFWEICRRLLMIRTTRRIFAGMAVFGLLTIPYTTFVSFFLDERWNLGPGGRGLFFAGSAAIGIAGLAIYGGRGERDFRESPSNVLRMAGRLLAVAIVLIALGGLSPWFGGMLFFFFASSALLGVLVPALNISLFSIIPSVMRPHAAALVGVFQTAGGMLGAIFFAGVDKRFGIAGAMVAIAAPGVLGALVIGSASKFIESDLDRMIDEVLEDEEIKRITASGGHLPMLSCRGIDFSYGQLQVLFGVDFTVDDGEMVALLGVNGAGKSTLLKVISGIGLPTAGSVRFRGADITYLDAERRLRLGITQVPGGRAVFRSMTVVENLRSFGYTVAKDRRALEASIDECFAAFPRLAERRESNAGNLSGGEQQMLGLAKALILKPRLLVIDELSLGLAPVIVGQLLEMVERINAEGTAVVLVEQSVNIALNLVDHAYFMEKGEMRFDGRSDGLLARDDLLRAVFLQGAPAKGGA